MAKNDLQGALDLLILKTLSQVGSMHGYGILMDIRRVSADLLIVEEGSLYPGAAPHGTAVLGARKLVCYRLRPQSELVNAHACRPGTACQSRKELGAGCQGR